jgi:hypothetical protein
LLAQFDEHKDNAYLREAIGLHREVLALCPDGHTQRLESLQSLGRILCKRECQSWPEAFALFNEAVERCPAGYPARSSLLSDMSVCFLDPESPLRDLSIGISHLAEGHSDAFSHVNQRLGHAVSDLRRVDVAYMEFMRYADSSTKDYYCSRIVDLYAQVISLLPRAANLGLDHKTRLQVVAGSDEIARNAAARALLLERTSQAVELLEEGRGIFWSQTLQLRTTGFDGVPDIDRAQLLKLLRMLAHGAREARIVDQTMAQREEALERRRRLNEETETLIARIRDYPGCARFFMAPTFESLMNGLPNGYVIILNASKLAHHALLLHKATSLAVAIELQLPSKGFDVTALRAQLPRDIGATPVQKDEIYSRGMRLDSGHKDLFEDVLSQLWTSVVQPVIQKLGLPVSDVPPVHRRHLKLVIAICRT